MKLKTLVKSHVENSSPNGLTDAFGDSFLCSHNKIFSTVRNEVLKNNFKFSNELNIDYLVLSLSQLENILSTKTIPYYNNFSTLQKIETSRPGLTDFENIIDNFKFNFHLHESCHAVCRQFTSQTELSELNPVMLRLIEESFANTCEYLGVIDVDSEIHEIFWLINSYTALFETRENLLNVLEQISFAELFAFTLYGYIHSNYLHEEISNDYFQRIVRVIFKDKKLEQNLIRQLKTSIGYCFNLDPTFKYISTDYYMKLNHPKLKHTDLMATDWLSEFENSKALQGLINKLTRLFP